MINMNTKDKIIDFFNEKAFLLAVFLLVSMYTLRFSFLDEIKPIHILFYLMRGVSYGLVFIKFVIDFFNKKYGKELLLIILFGIFMLIISYTSKTINYLIYYIYIIVGKDVDYIKIIKAGFLAIISSIGIIVVSHFVGIIREEVSVQEDRQRIRHSLGFKYATYLSTYLFYATLYFILFKNIKINIGYALILLIINTLAFLCTKTKSAFFFSILAVVVTIVVNKFEKLQVYHKIYSVGLKVFPILIMLFVILASVFYNPDNIILKTIDKILTGRLTIGHKVISLYGVKLFGQYIEFAADNSNGVGYNIVDSSYVLYLVILGLIFTIVLAVILTYFSILISKKKDVYMTYVFIILLTHSAFDPQLLQMSHSVFMFILSYKKELINLPIENNVVS